MRTTLDLDEDVVAAARELARLNRVDLGSVVSDLVRKGLTVAGSAGAEAAPIPLIRSESPITSQMVLDGQDDDEHGVENPLAGRRTGG